MLKNQKVKLTYYWLRIFLLEGGDPLTTEEVEEKEGLLEEASEYVWC